MGGAILPAAERWRNRQVVHMMDSGRKEAAKIAIEEVRAPPNFGKIASPRASHRLADGITTSPLIAAHKQGKA